MTKPTYDGPAAKIRRGRGPELGARLRNPAALKTAGYLISSASVGLLGLAAFPGADKAGLLPALFAGMATSLAGMAFRWLSYRLEARSKVAAAPIAPDRGQAGGLARRLESIARPQASPDQGNSA